MGATKEKVNKWFIASKKHEGDPFNLDDLEISEPPKDTYHADPFLCEGKLFYEDYDYDYGRISCDGEVVMDLGFHASFPAVFKDEGKYFMTPERGAIVIYEADDFPRGWRPICQVAEGMWGDPILYKTETEYFIFATREDHKLNIFRSKTLHSGWEEIYNGEHMNSRSAGHLFWLDGKLIRPVQNCEKGYGEGLIFKEITILPYTEKEIKRIDPQKGWTGMHTFNFDSERVVVDGRVKL